MDWCWPKAERLLTKQPVAKTTAEAVLDFVCHPSARLEMLAHPYERDIDGAGGGIN